MAKEQKAIAKLLNGNDLINFYRFPIKNKTKIINNIVELYATSLSMLKDDLKDFDKFMIFETDSYGNVIDTIFECDSSEFLDMIKEFYKDYYGRYPSEDKYDSERWGYIVSGHKNYKESRKYARKNLKESTDESFSLYDLNKHDPFVKEWVKNINKELKDVSIESIGDSEIIFRVWFDETIDLDIFDDIVTDCMPRILIEFMSDMNIDFGYQFVYADDKFTENDFVFIRFIAW